MYLRNILFGNIDYITYVWFQSLNLITDQSEFVIDITILFVSNGIKTRVKLSKVLAGL